MTRRLRVRMYRMGFGDCFLLSVLDDGGDRHILVDCGSITEGKPHVARVVQSVIDACKPPGGGPPRLELVIGTHRHRDHVGGFKDDHWKEVEVGEVWMPWTEDPEDPVAGTLRNRQSGFARALTDALATGPVDDDDEPIADAPKGRLTLRTAMLGVAMNALTNEKAMATLHRGFAGGPPRRFLPVRGVPCEARVLAGMPGLRIHVLGPPRDEAAIASMTPPKAEAYLARRAAARLRVGASGDAAAGDDRPTDGAFRASWRIDPKVFRRHPDSTFRADDERKIDATAEDPDGDLAAAIDRAVNNTSLILVFEIGDQWLLFPGDAQWGTWNAALKDPASRRLLERTTLYKIGHHGSENATPRSLIDDVIAQPYTALLSMREMSQWPNIPRGPLLAAMAGKGAKVVRNDAAAAPGAEAPMFVDWEAEIGA